MSQESETSIPIRKIIHIDMDAFYASVEQLDNPDLRGKPIAVGGSAERGVVAAASYEARKYGVKSAMASSIAVRKCPNLIFVKPRFERYKEISLQIRAIFFEYTDLVEPLAYDEAFLDVTTNKKGILSATKLAEEIRLRIQNELGLTASAGISINKFTAKMATDINKPNGQLTIPPHQVEAFLEALPVASFYGVGKVTAEKMKALRIKDGKDLKAKSLTFLAQYFGKQGVHLYGLVRGIQKSEVKPNRERKSIAAERTFDSDLHSKRAMLVVLEKISEELARRILKSNTSGKTLTLKIKYSDFSLQTKSKTLSTAISDKETIFALAEEIMEELELKMSVRLLGLGLTKLDSPELEQKFEAAQLTLDF